MSLVASWKVLRAGQWEGPYSTEEIKVMYQQRQVESFDLLMNGSNPSVRRLQEWGVFAMCDTSCNFVPGYNNYAGRVEMQRQDQQHEKEMFNIRNQRYDEISNRESAMRREDLRHERDMVDIRHRQNSEMRERELANRRAELEAEITLYPKQASYNLDFQKAGHNFRIEDSNIRNRHTLDTMQLSSNIRINEFREIELPRFKEIEIHRKKQDHEIKLERLQIESNQSLKMACIVAVAMTGFFVAGLAFMTVATNLLVR
jgi:hypothetical protein